MNAAETVHINAGAPGPAPWDVTEARMGAAARAREDAWRRLGSSATPLGAMGPSARADADAASAAFRAAEATLVAGLWERRGRWRAPGGKVYRLDADGTALCIHDPAHRSAQYQRKIAETLLALDEIDARRFGVGRGCRA